MPKGFFSGSEVAASKPPPSRYPQCGTCGLLKTCNSPKMEVHGDGKKRILVVGEAPGSEEDKQGIPFVGKPGQHLRRTLRGLDVNLDRDCWSTNSLICRPPKNATPTDVQIDACLPNIVRTVESLRPRTVVLLGGPAVKSVIGWLWKDRPGGVTRWTGWAIPSQQLNAWVCPTFHPSYVVRERDDGNEVAQLFFERDLRRAVGFTKRPWKEVPDYKSQVELLYNDQEAARAVDEIIDAREPTAFDYETSQLKPEGSTNAIVCASVSNGERTIAFPWYGVAIDAMAVLLSDARVPKIASNLKFEDRWTRYVFDFRVRGWWHDTMLSAHHLDHRRGISGLKFQSFVQLGFPLYNEHIERFLHTNQIKEIATKDLLLYCGLDSLLAWHLALKQREMME